MVDEPFYSQWADRLRCSLTDNSIDNEELVSIIEALEQALETTKAFRMNKASKAIEAELERVKPQESTK